MVYFINDSNLLTALSKKKKKVLFFLLTLIYLENSFLNNECVCTRDGEGNGNPLQYSFLENSHEQRSLAGYTVHGVARVRHVLVTKSSSSNHVHVRYMCVYKEMRIYTHTSMYFCFYFSFLRQNFLFLISKVSGKLLKVTTSEVLFFPPCMWFAGS